VIDHLPSSTWFFALACLALLPAAVVAADHPDEPKKPRLAVSGNGEVRAEPDRATVRLGVTAQAEGADAAQRQVNRVAAGILEAVRGLGIDDKAVQTSQLSLYPVYSERQHRLPQSDEPSDPEIVGYRASNVVSVRLDDLPKIGPAIDGAVGAGANEVQGVDFQLEDDLGARRQALKRAVGEARAKAEAMAEALGLRLGGVIEIREGGAVVQPMKVSAMAFRAADSSASVSPGEVAVSASVDVVYELVPKD